MISHSDMTPQQKAIEIYHSFDKLIYFDDRVHCKDCALIAIKEIKLALIDNHDYTKCKVIFDYWEEVKIELEKL